MKNKMIILCAIITICFVVFFISFADRPELREELSKTVTLSERAKQLTSPSVPMSSLAQPHLGNATDKNEKSSLVDGFERDLYREECWQECGSPCLASEDKEIRCPQECESDDSCETSALCEPTRSNHHGFRPPTQKTVEREPSVRKPLGLKIRTIALRSVRITPIVVTKMSVGKSEKKKSLAVFPRKSQGCLLSGCPEEKECVIDDEFLTTSHLACRPVSPQGNAPLMRFAWLSISGHPIVISHAMTKRCVQMAGNAQVKFRPKQVALPLPA